MLYKITKIFRGFGKENERPFQSPDKRICKRSACHFAALHDLRKRIEHDDSIKWGDKNSHIGGSLRELFNSGCQHLAGKVSVREPFFH